MNSTAEILPISQLVRRLSEFLDPDSVAGLTPTYIARRGRLDGVALRLDFWEEVRDQATLAVDLAERDELLDRLHTASTEETTLGEVAEALDPPQALRAVPIQVLPHARADLRTAARAAQSTRNLAGFLAHFARGYLQGTAVTDDTTPGPVLVRDVAPAYHEGERAFRILWARSGPTRSQLTLVAVRQLQGSLQRAWTFAPPMDASEDRGQ